MSYSRFDRQLFAGVVGLGVGWLALLESGLAHRRWPLAAGLQACVMVVVFGRVDDVE